MGCIYIARNIINGKCYIGKTVKTMNVRQAWHRCTAERGEGWNFHNALRKYGYKSFTWSVLLESDDYDILGRAEQDLILKHNTKRPNGYNLTDGGDGTIGKSPETIARVADFHRGRKRSDETRQRISMATKGRRSRLGAVLSPATRQKISESNRGNKHSQSSKAKIGLAFKGKPKSVEQKIKMSKARKAWWAKRRTNAEHAMEQTTLFSGVV
jgi:group I intron endonuclease